MPPVLDKDKITRVTLEAIRGIGGNLIDLKDVVLSVATRFTENGARSVNDPDVRTATLRCLNELLRNGIIGLGDGKSGGWNPAFGYLTEHGKVTADQVCRDPINQSGYMAFLEQDSPLDSTTKGYVEEALNTYCNCCYRATAVLIGAAIENLVLDLRDELVLRLKRRGEVPAKALESWRVKEVVEAISAKVLPDLRSAAKSDEKIRKLKEDAESYFLPVAAEFRRLRNDAGHPAALAPVQPANAHANLLLFPSTVALLRQIKTWVIAFYA